LDALGLRTQADPALYDAISRVAPAMRCFEFRDIDEFKRSTISIFAEWLPRLDGRSFHVRLHARGFKFDWRTPDAERYFNDWILNSLKDRGSPESISFSKPDAVIAIDTIDERAGISLWAREELERHHLLRPD
jgi:tRNA(Ser,Leu) C12 N-acetylase TAN1